MIGFRNALLFATFLLFRRLLLCMKTVQDFAAQQLTLRLHICVSELFGTDKILFAAEHLRRAQEAIVIIVRKPGMICKIEAQQRPDFTRIQKFRYLILIETGINESFIRFAGILSGSFWCMGRNVLHIVLGKR